MTREIKFRAWIKHPKQMIFVDNIDFSKRMINTESTWRLFDEIKLIQFTGLRDKNGVEIYEGDVCKNTSGEIGVIEYGNGMFVSRFVPPYDWDVMAPCDARLDHQEVIGNIYENPDLIKTESE